MNFILLKYSIIFSTILPISWQYIEHFLEESGFCPPFRNKSIKLGNNDKSSLHVQQTTLNNHSIPWSEYSCKLDITSSSREEGLIAVIQHLALRKNTESGKCIDYVQFTKLDGTKTRFCDNLDLRYVGPENNRVIQTNLPYVIAQHNYLHVEIFISEEPPTHLEKMELDFTITAFKSCDEIMGHSRSKYKPCDYFTNYCIYYEFYIDSNNINCPLSNCLDDNNCFKLKPVINNSIGQRVIIGSLSTLFLLFLIFIIFLWYSRTYKMFCWAHHFATNTATTPPTLVPGEQNTFSVSRVIEMSERPARTTTSSEGNVTNAADQDKDMPPSYDSLFPR